MPPIEAATLRTDIREFIAETFFVGDETDELADSDSFMQKGIIDSTGVLELTSFLEEKYNLTVEDEEMIPDNLDTVANLVGFITRKMS
ncbi:MAG: acyl carrier protein [candidate division Zixibacteria bacterium]|nr:acyl carrier protein [candidate division Zixibacteria bacterium]